MSRETGMTIEYYNQHADEYVESTLHADMSEARNKFLSYIPEGGTILDFGCGSGRDSKAFLDAGYKVTALDGSEELCKRAELLLEQQVLCCKFQTFKANEQFDGIWACASLLHLKKEELEVVIDQLVKSLKPQGVLYMSFKYGEFSGERDGRWFVDMTRVSLAEMLNRYSEAQIIECWITEDVRATFVGKWMNCILKGIDPCLN